MIKKVRIKNFKCFEGWFELNLKEGVNILVGNNEVGKSTILEAIHLALTGFYRGVHITRQMTQYLFNKKIIDQYLADVKNLKEAKIPELIIEIYFSGQEYPRLEGNGNSLEKKEVSGICFKLMFDSNYEDEYSLFLENQEVSSLPIEYYEYMWYGFNRERITVRSIPMKSFFIDTSATNFKDGSDVYISKIVKDYLSEEEVLAVSKSFRQIRDVFNEDENIKKINEKLTEEKSILDKEVSISVNLGSGKTWESSMITEFNRIPYSNVGRGLQNLFKTHLALENFESDKDMVILIEEPENHLSHSNMNRLVNLITQKTINDKSQLIISTHSSFVANKLGLINLILLSQNKVSTFRELEKDTINYFKKVSGYDTLRLLLCKEAILVEGPSDELIIQKAYYDKYKRLPIEDGIDVISVGTAFLRFLELADNLKLKIRVVTDNDGNVASVKKKYSKYFNKDNIKIFFDSDVHSNETITDFNYNTLEPCLLRANSLEKLNKILNKNFESEEELLKHMENNKTDVAVKIFDTHIELNYPDYIKDAVNDV